MSRDPICDFVLSITTSNAVGWDKNVITTFQELLLFFLKSCRSRCQLNASTYQSVTIGFLFDLKISD